MLFDDDEQLEVRHVISLAYHDISIYSGGDVTPEGELFIKRNALCLSRRKHGPEVGPDSQLSKPFFLFSEDCSAKEDFYFALLRNQEETIAADRKAPIPMNFQIENIIALVQKLHSSEDHIHTRWLNAFLGRVFLGLYKTRDLENLIREKITKKISRVKRPSFLSGIKLQKIDLGASAPYVTNPRLRDLTVEGECVAEADVRYTGGFRIEVAATARIDLGARFKVREVNLVLAVVLKKLEGHVLFKIKPPPSNRIWFSFQTMPKMEMTIEPIVSTRQITYTLILRQIENRIKEVIAESVVHPFWDDIPFFKTEHKKWRGGIFQDDDAVAPPDTIEEDVAQQGRVDAVDRIEQSGEPPLADMRPMEKSHSLPLLESKPPTGLFGRKLVNKTYGDANRAGSSTSLDILSASPTRPTQPAHDTEANGETETKSVLDRAVSAISAAASRSHNSSPAPTPSTSPVKPSPLSGFGPNSSTSSLETKETVNDNEHTSKTGARRDTASSVESASQPDYLESKSPTPSLKSHTGSLSRGLFRRLESSNSIPGLSGQGGAEGDARRTTLAAVSKAAMTARTWGWNAIQRKGDGHKDEPHSEGSSSLDLSQPMGRGQPLPPPGTPLPLPQKTGRSKINPIPTPNRKPLPPPRPRASELAEHKNGNRSVPPPPLPKRRLMSETAESGGENMLVVEAPEDSRPGTPLAEDGSTYKQPWAADAETEDSPEERNSFEHATEEQTREDHGRDSPDEHPSDDLDHHDHEGSHGPITAIPVVVDDDEDDDGYSGWMENTDSNDDELPVDEHGSS